MNTKNRALAVGSALFGLALLVSSPTAIAENDITPSFTPQAPENWEIREHSGVEATELISVLAAGSFSTMCRDGHCGIFVEPAAGCVPGAKYPLLINSAKQVGVVATQCTIIPGATDGEVRHVVLLKKQDVLIRAMMQEIDLTIAFPTQAGQMNVLEVRMAGVAKVLAKIMPDVQMPTPTPDSSDSEAPQSRETGQEQAPETEYRL